MADTVERVRVIIEADGTARLVDGKHNQSYHFITFEQYKYIESLELAGNKQEAMRVTSELLSQHLGGDLSRNMGLIERGWTGIKNVASSAWDAMLNVGRAKTSTDRITEAAKALADAEAYLKAGARVAQVGGGSAQDGVDRARAELETAQESARLERRAAEDRSRRAQDEVARIAADREKKKKSDDGDSTYDRLNQQVQRRLALAQAEEDQGYRLAASERYRLEGLQQISDAEGKIGPQRAAQLRQLVNETAEVIRNNEARTDLLKTRQKNDEMLAKELAAQERELATMMASNERLREQIEEVGLTTEQLGRLKVERIEATLATERENLVMAQNIEGNEAQVRIIERRIALMERQRDLTRQLGESKAAEQDRKEAAAEAKKFTDELRRDLTHALSHAFTNNKDPLEAFGAALENTIKVRATRGLAESLMNPIAKAFEQGAGEWFKGFGGGSGGSGNGGTGGIDLWAESANGNVFNSPGLSAYSGKVVDRPTVFPFARGAGLMGEAGPEAILPLRRNGQGVLGVQAQGGGGMTIVQNVKVINNTGSQVSVRQQSGNGGFDMSLILDAVDSGMADRVGAGEGALPRALEGRYNLRTAVN